MSFTKSEEMLLDAVSAFLRGESVSWTERIPAADWQGFFRLAMKQHVLPMVYESAYRCESAAGESELEAGKALSIQQVTSQIKSDTAFYGLYSHLRDLGFHPLVVKGVLCRSIYPDGEHRVSADEDLLIPEDEFAACCRAFREYGMSPIGDDDVTQHEIGWTKGPLYVELHRALFPPRNRAYGTLNGYFDDIHEKATEYFIGERRILSMPPHEHLLYLILHAYKHFIHSGFGIRQICDIGLWAAKYGNLIDWELLYSECEKSYTLKFTRAVFAIAKERLGIPVVLPEEWEKIESETEPMLADLLLGGVYGSSSSDRLHSATVTLNAVESDRNDEKTSLLRTIFPPLDSMASRYPVLKKRPYLLPVTWGRRIVGYVRNGGASPAESMKIAKERTELLRLYGIIK